MYGSFIIRLLGILVSCTCFALAVIAIFFTIGVFPDVTFMIPFFVIAVSCIVAGIFVGRRWAGMTGKKDA